MKATIEQLKKRHNKIISLLLCRPLDNHEVTLLKYYRTKIKELKKGCCRWCLVPLGHDKTNYFCSVTCRNDFYSE